MAIPTKADGDLAAIDDLHSVIMVRLRNFRHAGANRSSSSVTSALRDYRDKIVEFINETADQVHQDR